MQVLNHAWNEVAAVFREKAAVHSFFQHFFDMVIAHFDDFLEVNSSFVFVVFAKIIGDIVREVQIIRVLPAEKHFKLVLQVSLLIFVDFVIRLDELLVVFKHLDEACVLVEGDLPQKVNKEFRIEVLL